MLNVNNGDNEKIVTKKTNLKKTSLIILITKVKALSLIF